MMRNSKIWIFALKIIIEIWVDFIDFVIDYCVRFYWLEVKGHS